MHSRVLIVVGAWLFGALTATAGSLYAVAQLGQGLVAQHTKQVTVAMVNAELRQDGGNPLRIGPTASGSATASPKASPTRRSGFAHPAAATPVTRLFQSTGGWAYASCGEGGARLLNESPAQDFEVSHVDPGPATVASVTFIGSSGGVSMKVSCSASGVPVEDVSTFSWGGSTHHDE